MKCFSCFSDITEKYNFHWYPLDYCSKCNLVSIEIVKLNTFIDFSIKQNMQFKTIKDELVYNYVREYLLKKFNLSNRISDSKLCHSMCSFSSNNKSLCKYEFINDVDIQIYFCILDNKIMFNITKFEKIIKQKIEKSYKKWFLLKRLKLTLLGETHDKLSE